MTLVEVMIATAIFGISLASVFGLIRFMYRTAIDNVAEGVALHAAEGIMDQIRVMPYETFLLNAARAQPGTSAVPLLRYRPATASGTIAQLVTQNLSVNGTVFAPLPNVDLSVTLSTSFALTSEVPLDISTRLLIHEYAGADFSHGVTVELIYRYRSAPDRNYHTRTLRTFIAQSVS